MIYGNGQLLSANKTMIWKKLGLILSLDGLDSKPEWMNSHMAVPVVEKLDNQHVRVYFSTRNSLNQSLPASIDLNMETFENSNLSHQPIISLGNVGCFDDSGFMTTDVLDTPTGKYLYYIGWNLGVTVPFRNSIGIAAFNHATKHFERLFEGPILDRTYKEPHFCASCCVLFENSTYKMWYLSCVRWLVINGTLTHCYHIKYAESKDGINWERNGVIAIDFESEYEYAISVPRVVNLHGTYHMWFSSRATQHTKTYRIRHAISTDGIRWKRSEGFALDTSKDGWDSEMVCYPYVFQYKDKLYMLYNGNAYGKTGIGIAVCEENK